LGELLQQITNPCASGQFIFLFLVRNSAPRGSRKACRQWSRSGRSGIDQTSTSTNGWIT